MFKYPLPLSLAKWNNHYFWQNVIAIVLARCANYYPYCAKMLTTKVEVGLLGINNELLKFIVQDDGNYNDIS